MCSYSGMLQFDLQFYEELTIARVKTVKFISGAFFLPTGQLVSSYILLVGVNGIYFSSNCLKYHQT